MKFEEHYKEGFTPFKIVVETQEEANYLYAIVAATCANTDEILGYNSYDLFDYLETKVISENIPNLITHIDGHSCK